MKYNVHLYVGAVARFPEIEAESQAQAVEKAQEEFDPDLHAMEWDEGTFLGALVDEAGDDEYVGTRYHELASAKAYLLPAEVPGNLESASVEVLQQRVKALEAALKAWQEEWPGGLEEAESAWKGWKGRYEELSGLVKELVAGVKAKCLPMVD